MSGKKIVPRTIRINTSPIYSGMDLIGILPSGGSMLVKNDNIYIYIYICRVFLNNSL